MRIIGQGSIMGANLVSSFMRGEDPNKKGKKRVKKKGQRYYDTYRKKGSSFYKPGNKSGQKSMNKYQSRFFHTKALLQESDITLIQDDWREGKVICFDSDDQELIEAYEFLVDHACNGLDFELGELEDYETEDGGQSVRFEIKMEGHGDFPADEFSYMVTNQ